MKQTLSHICSAFVCLCMITGCTKYTKNADQAANDHIISEHTELQILVEGQQHQSIVFELNNSKAAQSLYDQLPIEIEVEDYSDDEKIYDPMKPLDVNDAPSAQGPAGTLAYYEPWGNVAMFYGTCQGANGLYELGEAITNVEQIETLQGSIRISKLQEPDEKAEADKTIDNKSKPAETETGKEDDMLHLNIIVGTTAFSATLYDHETVRAWISQLPMTLTMDDLHGNEKYVYFSSALPTSVQSESQIHSGDLKLFGNDCLVLFYEDFTTSYSYTPLGQIDDPSGLKEALGSGSVTIRFELMK